MKKPLTLLFVLFLVLFSSSAYAQSLEQHNIDFYIAFNKVVVISELVFDTPLSGNILLELPEDADAITVYVDDKMVEAQLVEGETKKVNLNLNSTERVKLSYRTSEMLEKSNFLVSFKSPYDTAKMNIRLFLPENAQLAKPVEGRYLSTGSVFPKPAGLETDGRSIVIVWEKENLAAGEETSLFVAYKERSNLAYYVAGAALVAVLALIAVIVMITKKQKKKAKQPRPKVKTRTVVKKVVEKEGIEKHLKEDEEQIVNILKQREGRCEQGTLRVITGFSKAKLSGLLKELEERKVIHKEKRGKKNLVFLRNI